MIELIPHKIKYNYLHSVITWGILGVIICILLSDQTYLELMVIPIPVRSFWYYAKIYYVYFGWLSLPLFHKIMSMLYKEGGK